MTTQKKTPVIVDTDIGGDIDDTWALAMLLKCPELDLKLVTSDTGDTVYRAKICAKMLERAGRADVDVGVGVRQISDGPRERQAEWVSNYKLSSYPGRVLEDGVDAIIRAVDASREPVTLVCIGPVPNIAEALGRRPDIASRTHFVGMFGSVRKQHRDKPGAIAEYNVLMDVASCRKVFEAPWRSMVITPLDTCGNIILKGSLYARLAASEDPLVRDVLENYRLWRKAGGMPDHVEESSVLFDTVAVHLAFSTKFLKMERLGLRVRDDGFTILDKDAPKMDVAMDWTDLDGYHEHLTNILLSR